MQEAHRPGSSSIELVPVQESNEGAFTLLLPRGWENHAVMVRPTGSPRSLISSRRPDGAVYLFSGDLRLPVFAEPGTGMFSGLPLGTPEQHFTPAEPFFRHYLQQLYAGAPGFRIAGAAPCGPLEELAHREANRLGLQPRSTSICLPFEYTDPQSGLPVRGRIYGLTLSFGNIWAPEVSGILTWGADDPAAYERLWFEIARSRQENPQWRALQNQAHQQRMAQIAWDHQNTMQQMQANHQDNMAWLQQSAESHQARMDNLHTAADAQMQGWYAQQATGDAAHRSYLDTLNGQTSAAPGRRAPDGDWNHRRFLNTVTEQETVVGPDGSTYQVEAGHERYYRHKRDDTYLGTDNFTERDDLRRRFGVNPDDYEEVRIRR